ncbi:hypothetical protein ABID29_001992 [Streptococcus rupicaprae]|uniref:Uncharacterized protein n=1 Tax=Streptococcus rupicaprae TaxID=759619 RepID=A0ABV2FJY1_9STRE
MDNLCFGCDVKQQIADEEIEEMIAFQLAMESEKVNREEWLRRQSICEHCSARQGSTCGKCGCFYKFRTALEGKSCPISLW